MYDDLLGPRKEDLKETKKKCIGGDAKPAQPEKFDSHKSNDDQQDAWADVGSDIGEEDLEEIEDLIMEYDEDEDAKEVCDGGDACDTCADGGYTANPDLSELEDL